MELVYNALVSNNLNPIFNNRVKSDHCLWLGLNHVAFFDWSKIKASKFGVLYKVEYTIQQWVK
jgi:hypothetical protein